MFFGRLGDPIYEMVTAAYEQGHLHEKLCMGIINLIPKEGKDSRYLKNLRPITLLNGDYKLIEKLVANRLESALDKVVHSDQQGFFKNRSIAINIRKFFDIMHYTDKNQLESLVLSLDFEKCFDKIETCAIIGALEFFWCIPVPGPMGTHAICKLLGKNSK